MTDTDAFYTTGCGNCACSRAAVIHAGGCPRALHIQLRNELPKPVPEPAIIHILERCAVFFLVAGWVMLVASLLARLAQHLGWA